MLQRNVSRHVTWLFVAAAVGLSACSDTTASCNSNCTPAPPVTPPVNLEVISGPTTGVVGDTLPAPVLIKATNPDGTPAAGATINISLTNGGFVENRTATTDADGNVSSGKWLLGIKAGNQRLVAEGPGSTTPLTVNVSAAPRPFFKLDAAPGMAGVWPTDSAIPVANTWVAVDEFNNRVGAGTDVHFTALDGSSFVGDGTTQNATSEDNGDLVLPSWFLNAAPGAKRLVGAYLVNGIPKADTLTVEAVPPPS